MLMELEVHGSMTILPDGRTGESKRRNGYMCELVINEIGFASKSRLNAMAMAVTNGATDMIAMVQRPASGKPPWETRAVSCQASQQQQRRLFLLLVR